jgi:hypothetical protein
MNRGKIFHLFKPKPQHDLHKNYRYITNTENVYIAVVLLIYIREVLGSNLGRNTGYPDCGLVIYLSPSNSCSIIHPIILRYTV